MSKLKTQEHTPVTLSESLIGSLKEITGADNVFYDTESLEAYSHDETEDLSFPPQVVVKPDSTEQVSAILKLASAENIPVTPRGAGTGLSGGCLPLHGGIALSLERMNRILEIDTTNFICVTEPGVIVQTLQEAIEEKNLFYPVDPASRGSCFIGGNVAENSGGPRAVKYGVTKDFVLGLTAVLPNGDIIKTGGKLYKDVTGYNLTQTLVGSEGTLAVITEILLKLIPLPSLHLMLMIPFPSLEQAAKTVSAIMSAGIDPSALEFMERDAIIASREQLGTHIDYDDAAAHLLIELDGNNQDLIDERAEKIGEIAMAHEALDVLLAESKQKQEELWNIRRSLSEAVKSRSVYKEEDTVVPRDKIPELLSRIKELCARWKIASVCYGHAGDGNIHVNLLKDDLPDDVWNNGLDTMIRELFAIVVDLGGSLTGEHGVGYSQREYISIMKTPAELAIMKRVKDAFDPQGILNPGKIFPTE